MNDPTQPLIRVRPDGPYVVWGGVPLQRIRAVVDDHDDPVAWDEVADHEAGPSYPLCRCGASSKKPFCDGTHATKAAEWSASRDGDPSYRFDESARTIEGHGITVKDDRGICGSAGFCATRLGNVWKMVGDTSDPDVRRRLTEIIDRCPTGALAYELADGTRSGGGEAGIDVVADGPLRIRGGVPVRLPDGTYIESRDPMSLCRCGESRNKPLCDGSHVATIFRDGTDD